jgi:transcriptional regulator with XRE-family HTH domain
MTIQWTAAMDALFETCNDREVAQQLGLSRVTVLRRRKALNIPPKTRTPTRLTDESIVAKLGTVSDAELGRQYGVTRERIRQIRSRHGIAKYEEKTDWASVESRLGVDTDESIARTLGVSAQMVRQRRKDLGLKKTFVTPLERQLDARDDIVRNWRDLLGKTTDYKLAKAWGLTAPAVQRLRQRLGRPPACLPPAAKVDWEDPANLARLGVEPDGKLAREWGVSTTTIVSKRKRLGIPAVPRSCQSPTTTNSKTTGPFFGK